ncbi:uncharacterized protein LTR77_001225 [Saxophila tyrrhenica]|uniref:Uncharacterized protein n=1 Tax=Saxophila tyrrhenica TaxID=1690608 RepID=A0AAV9PJP3_9PEZI|nr:hypothetical protein LTR77_001225 [Saxophila tyrrhenica]
MPPKKAAARKAAEASNATEASAVHNYISLNARIEGLEQRMTTLKGSGPPQAQPNNGTDRQKRTTYRTPWTVNHNYFGPVTRNGSEQHEGRDSLYNDDDEGTYLKGLTRQRPENNRQPAEHPAGSRHASNSNRHDSTTANPGSQVSQQHHPETNGEQTILSIEPQHASSAREEGMNLFDNLPQASASGHQAVRGSRRAASPVKKPRKGNNEGTTAKAMPAASAPPLEPTPTPSAADQNGKQPGTRKRQPTYHYEERSEVRNKYEEAADKARNNPYEERLSRNKAKELETAASSSRQTSVAEPKGPTKAAGKRKEQSPPRKKAAPAKERSASAPALNVLPKTPYPAAPPAPESVASSKKRKDLSDMGLGEKTLDSNVAGETPVPENKKAKLGHGAAAGKVAAGTSHWDGMTNALAPSAAINKGKGKGKTATKLLNERSKEEEMDKKKTDEKVEEEEDVDNDDSGDEADSDDEKNEKQK